MLGHFFAATLPPQGHQDPKVHEIFSIHSSSNPAYVSRLLPERYYKGKKDRLPLRSPGSLVNLHGKKTISCLCYFIFLKEKSFAVVASLDEAFFLSVKRKTHIKIGKSEIKTASKVQRRFQSNVTKAYMRLFSNRRLKPTAI